MIEFAKVEDAARARLGDEEVERRLPDVKTPEALRAVLDYRYLAHMAMRIFSAGFRWRVVQAKWPDIEEAFEGFDPLVVGAYDDARMTELGNDRRVIRHMGKIGAIVSNARAIQACGMDHGGVGALLAGWPVDETVQLWWELKRRFKMLGGASGPRFLRLAGRDTFILTPDVLRALARYGVYEGKGTSKKDLTAIQAAFNAWSEESGHPLSHLSMMLAGAVD